MVYITCTVSDRLKKAGLFFGQGLIHMVECAKIRFIRTGHEAIPMTLQKLYEKEKKQWQTRT